MRAIEKEEKERLKIRKRAIEKEEEDKAYSDECVAACSLEVIGLAVKRVVVRITGSRALDAVCHNNKYNLKNNSKQ
jgi:hypothetical protein